jgi:DNA helicase II / ATP-dependent DNA helicase PcrA
MQAIGTRINGTEAQERAHLERVKARLNQALERIDTRLKEYARDVQAQTTYLWEHRADMDHAEKVSTRQSVQQAVSTGEAALGLRQRLQKLVATPYFGRFDFRTREQGQPTPIYVGIHAFYDDDLREHLVLDWRAPIASLFYDYEIGAASYEAPTGPVHGDIALKRQYRIRDGRMELMLESGLNIVDDVLQQELSRTADERMKHIVATIQRDQNAIIRNEHSPVLIIQGVAGSGKTSIALHRVAYLLYKFKETLTSRDILILSPNRVFGDYISNVLPELGEERIAETEMESLAHALLEDRFRFQTFAEQNALLLEKDDPALRQRIQAKASLDLLRKLDAYLVDLEKISLCPEDLWLGRRLVPAWSIAESFAKHRRLPHRERLGRVAQEIEQKIGIHYNHDIDAKERAELKAALKKMAPVRTLRAVYKDFYAWLGAPELFQPARGTRLEYADVFPLIYLRLRLEAVATDYGQVKHLLIDEMQDYTPVQYAVIAELFRCKKTILGDASQSVNPFSSSSAETIKEVFPQAYCAKLCKSYRSTYEITRFAQRITPNAELVAIERHGEPVQVIGCTNRRQEQARIRAEISAFADCGHHTLGIVCKTQAQADKLHRQLCEDVPGVHLLRVHSRVFKQGITVCAAQLAKGLEFDHVVVPHASAADYANAMDRSLLYIACTRAMHRLALIHVGEVTPLIGAPD